MGTVFSLLILSNRQTVPASFLSSDDNKLRVNRLNRRQKTKPPCLRTNTLNGFKNCMANVSTMTREYERDKPEKDTHCPKKHKICVVYEPSFTRNNAMPKRSR